MTRTDVDHVVVIPRVVGYANLKYQIQIISAVIRTGVVPAVVITRAAAYANLTSEVHQELYLKLVRLYIQIHFKILEPLLRQVNVAMLPGVDHAAATRLDAQDVVVITPDVEYASVNS